MTHKPVANDKSCTYIYLTHAQTAWAFYCMRFVMTNIKEYDSITIACQYKDDDGNPLSLAGVEIKSEMRTQNSALIDELEVTVSDVDQGLFHLRPTKTRLPTGYHNIDILFTKNGNRISSDTFHITVSRAVTQGPTNA